MIYFSVAQSPKQALKMIINLEGYYLFSGLALHSANKSSFYKINLTFTLPKIHI